MSYRMALMTIFLSMFHVMLHFADLDSSRKSAVAFLVSVICILFSLGFEHDSKNR